MKNIFATILLALFSAAATAQTGGITASDVRITRSDDGVTLEMTLDIAPGAVTSLQGVSVAPMLSDEAGHRVTFPHVLVNGKNRARIYKRHAKFRYTEIVKNPPYKVINTGRKTGSGTVDYSMRIAGEEWMNDADLGLVFKLISPAGERQEYTAFIAKAFSTPEQQPVPIGEIAPVERLSKTEPENSAESESESPPANETRPAVETASVPVNTVHTLSGTAGLDFETASSTLIPEFGRNKHELAVMDKIFGQIAVDPNTRIISLTVTGYSSPEQGYETNASLTHDRTMALSRYLQERYGFPAGSLKIRAVGEDWSGLRAVIAGSVPSFPKEVLEVIDSAESPDMKESRLKQMDGGAVWQRMEHDVFPRLRRIDYSVDFEVTE